MKPSKSDFDKWIKSASEVPWSPELEERILTRAKNAAGNLDDVSDPTRGFYTPGEDVRAEVSQPVRKRRRGRSRSVLVALAGTAAAVLVGVAVWNTGHVSQQQEQVTATKPGVSSSTSHGVTSSTKPALPTLPAKQTAAKNVVLLRTAPLVIRNLKLDSSVGGGPKDEVTATVVNTGSTPISRQDVFGVLSFHSGQGHMSSVLQSVDWITFVDATSSTILPGQSVTWSFKPVTAPKDSKGNLLDEPTLSFFWAGTTTQKQSTTTWQVIPAAVSVDRVGVRQTWATGQSFRVDTTIDNQTSGPIRWGDMLAVIWFDSPGTADGSNNLAQSGLPNSDSGFTAPGVSRYFTKVSGPPGAKPVLAAGSQANVTFDLVGPVNPDLTSLQPHVLLLRQGGTHS